MEVLTFITTLFYLVSTGGYFNYLFMKKEHFFKISFYLLATGFLFHTAAVIYAWVATGHMPVYNLRGTLLVAGWIGTGVFLIFQHKFQFKLLGIFAAPIAALVVITASQLPETALPANNIFNNFWLIFHITTIFIGDASFALACGLAIFYMVQEKAIKTKIQGFFFRRLPSLESIDNTGYACIVVGFTMLTLGLVTGMIYAKSIWGKFWSWDPKEIWSGISWLIYATLLHGRLSLGWRGRKSAIMAVIGFAVLLFTFLGVNFLMKGHHGEFTRF